MSLVAKEDAHAIPFPPLAAKRREAGKGGRRDPRLAAKLSLPPGKLVGGETGCRQAAMERSVVASWWGARRTVLKNTPESPEEPKG